MIETAEVPKSAAAGQAPDVAVLDSVWVPEFAAAGFLRPLDELDPIWVSAEYEPDFLDAFVAANRYGGRPVAAQAEADVAGLWVRRQALAEVGASVPQTWSELSDVCAPLVDAGRHSPLVVPGGSRAGEAASYCLLGLLAANGVQVLGPDRVTLDCPAAVECLAFLHQLVEAGALSAEVVGWELGRPIRQLAHGDADLCVGGSYEGPALAAAAELPADELWREFAFTQLPSGPSGPAGTLPASGYPTVNDQRAAALWPKDASTPAGYDLDDWIGGEIQVKYRQALDQFVANQNVDAFIKTMTQVDTRSG